MRFKEWFHSLDERVYTHSDSVYDFDAKEQRNVAHFSRGYDEAPVFVLTGYAGTGKTTVLPWLVESTELESRQIVFCSPTGKAAKVMTAKLRAEGLTARATTIHKAIYLPKAPRADMIERELFDEQTAYKRAVDSHNVPAIKEHSAVIKQLQTNLERAYKDDSPQFTLNVGSTVKNAHLIIVDEASMVDKYMADDLRSFGVPILAIGDTGQLPPINAGPGLLNRRADAALTEIHRQALDNPIIWASMLIREGRPVPRGTHGDGQLRVISQDEDDRTFDLDTDLQIICGTHDKRHRITRKIRSMCGFTKNDGPREGELMIITKNSRVYPDLTNGTFVMMSKDALVTPGSPTYIADFRDSDGKEYSSRMLQNTIEENYLGKGEYTCQSRDLYRHRKDDRVHEMDYAYAITCHKAQGSQWDECVVHDQSYAFREAADKWLYTAVTRAAKTLTIVEA